MNLHPPDLQRLSPVRPPDWRWRRAQALVAAGRYFSRRRDDAATGRAVRYLRALGRCQGGIPSAQVERHYPDLCAAHRLHSFNSTVKLVLEARLLAGQTPDEIARRTVLASGAIDAYEALLFQVRGRLDARDWILAHALGASASVPSAAPDPGLVLKALAYDGGPVVLEAVLPYLVGGKDLFDPPPDLSTPAGRRDQAIRLLVAAQMLPRDAATGKKLNRIASIMSEGERKPPARRVPASLLVKNLGFGRQELPDDVPAEQAVASSQSAATAEAAFGQIA